MKTPPQPGRLVKDEIEALGLSVAKAAKGLGVTRRQLHTLISGKSSISLEVAMRLEAGLGSSATAWLQMQMNYDLAVLRKRRPPLGVKRLAACREPNAKTRNAMAELASGAGKRFARADALLTDLHAPSSSGKGRRHASSRS
jgi:antitoxin HigA-1